jgi:hypothetical protein
MTDANKVFPDACPHVARAERAHVHTLVVETVDQDSADGYRYVTGPDQMLLCDFCTGLLAGFTFRLSQGLYP